MSVDAFKNVEPGLITVKVQAIQRHLHQNQNSQAPLPPPTDLKKTPPLQVPPIEQPMKTEMKPKPSAVQS